MACTNGKNGTPSNTDLLIAAQKQLLLLLSGKSTQEVETPNLGRVRFNQANVGDLQKLIDSLTAAVAAESGASYVRRGPISIEACP